MRDALTEMRHVGTIVVPHLDRFDDLSIKLLARVVPFVQKRWMLFADKRAEIDKTTLLNRFSQAVDVPVVTDKINDLHSGLFPTDSAPSLAHLAQELVLTNYSACVRWGHTLLGDRSLDAYQAAEVKKILALATLNRGMKDASLSFLSAAEEQTPSLTRKAHMACLQSLVVQKRIYDPELAMQHVRRGFGYLQQAEAGNSNLADTGLERAWLLNSAALNEAVNFRRLNSSECIARAMSYLKEAFSLAKPLRSTSANYLRFNLAANTVFLLEMVGQPRRALEALEGSFSQTILPDAEDGRGTEAFLYRRGVLVAKTGDMSSAISILESLVPRYEEKNAWFLSEQVCRALTALAAQSGDLERASTYAIQGFEICTRERSKCGQEVHYKNLIALYAQQGRFADKLFFESKCQILADGDSSSWVIPKATPKLPAYIPEVDLEETPKIDLNNYLVGNSDGKPRHVA